ncbi:MAG TPA: type II CAAX endopeptidase family protein [Dehalococcoidia bacterium]|nr:type II CAAX endopeptidase family protein [Dehalococcoidia bacterium]
MSAELSLAKTEAKTSSFPFWLLFISFTFAEILTAVFSVLAGLICHGVILVVLLVSSAFLNGNSTRNLVISLSLVPLVRIMSLSMPLASLPQIYWYLFIYAPLLIAGIVVMRITGVKAGDIGITVRGLWWQIPGGILLGLATGILEWNILRPQPLVGEFTLASVWIPSLIMFMTTGMVEEFIFRGVLQRTAVPSMGSRPGLFYISAIFAVLHIGHLSVLDVLVVFIIAIVFAFVAQRTKSLIGVIFAHGITNIFLYFVGPFLLS